MAPRTLVLYFHRVSDEISPAFPPMPIKVFEEVLKFLQRHFLLIPLEEAGNTFRSRKPRLVITFDDAYMDFHENALPLLVKYKIPALQNIITQCAETGKPLWTQRLNKLVEAYYFEDRTSELAEPEIFDKRDVKGNNIGAVALRLYRKLLDDINRDDVLDQLYNNLGSKYRETKMMGWKEVNESLKYNISFGSHTHTHQNLTLLDENNLEKELFVSAQLLQEKAGVRPTAIAFPNGQYNEKVVQKSELFGYKYLLTVEERSLKSNDLNENNFFIIPRLNIYNTSYWKNFVKLSYYFWFK